jgi:hypothetical protein
MKYLLLTVVILLPLFLNACTQANSAAAGATNDTINTAIDNSVKSIDDSMNN